MKKILLVVFASFLFGCGESKDKSTILTAMSGSLTEVKKDAQIKPFGVSLQDTYQQQINKHAINSDSDLSQYDRCIGVYYIDLNDVPDPLSTNKDKIYTVTLNKDGHPIYLYLEFTAKTKHQLSITLDHFTRYFGKQLSNEDASDLLFRMEKLRNKSSMDDVERRTYFFKKRGYRVIIENYVDEDNYNVWIYPPHVSDKKILDYDKKVARCEIIDQVEIASKEKLESILRAGNFKNIEMFCDWLKRYDPLMVSELDEDILTEVFSDEDDTDVDDEDEYDSQWYGDKPLNHSETEFI